MPFCISSVEGFNTSIGGNSFGSDPCGYSVVLVSKSQRSTSHVGAFFSLRFRCGRLGSPAQKLQKVRSKCSDTFQTTHFSHKTLNTCNLDGFKLFLREKLTSLFCAILVVMRSNSLTLDIWFPVSKYHDTMETWLREHAHHVNV